MEASEKEEKFIGGSFQSWLLWLVLVLALASTTCRNPPLTPSIAVPTSDIETGVICGSSCSVLVPTSISVFKMRLRIYCITSLFVLNIGVQVDHLSRTASTSAFYSTTATPYGFHICFCGGSIRQKCQLLFFDSTCDVLHHSTHAETTC